jgi:electron transport complex protein RnfG
MLAVSKDGGTVDAITASTITSRAFLEAVNKAYSVYSESRRNVLSGATSKKNDKTTGHEPAKLNNRPLK